VLFKLIVVFGLKALNICERELVNALYNEQQFDLLLAENTFIMQSREEIKQHLKLLRTCMNAINDMDAKF